MAAAAPQAAGVGRDAPVLSVCRPRMPGDRRHARCERLLRQPERLSDQVWTTPVLRSALLHGPGRRRRI
jgi:hypothetical protein